MENYAKAADDFRKVLQLKPNDADAKSRLKYAEEKHQWQGELRQFRREQRREEQRRNREPKTSVTPTPSPAR
jgi:Flp pilus assembly protein TadD